METVQFLKGPYTEAKVKKLTAGQLFFDTDGIEGVWLGTANGGIQIAKGGIEIIDLT